MAITEVKLTPLEAFVKAYLKKNKRLRSLKQFDILRKASVFIREKITNTCCSDAAAVVNLYTDKETEFTNSVKAFLANMPRKGNLKSLTRAKDLIDDFIAPSCCIASLMGYTFTPSGNATVTSDGVTAATSTVTLRVQVTGPFLSEILKIEFLIGASVISTLVDVTEFDDHTFSSVRTVPISGNVTVNMTAKITYKGGTVKTSSIYSPVLTDNFV